MSTHHEPEADPMAGPLTERERALETARWVQGEAQTATLGIRQAMEANGVPVNRPGLFVEALEVMPELVRALAGVPLLDGAAGLDEAVNVAVQRAANVVGEQVAFVARVAAQAGLMYHPEVVDARERVGRAMRFLMKSTLRQRAAQIRRLEREGRRVDSVKASQAFGVEVMQATRAGVDAKALTRIVRSAAGDDAGGVGGEGGGA